MNSIRKNLLRSVLLVVICFTLIIVIARGFISQMNDMIEGNIRNTITELAQHDLTTIENYVNDSWIQLEGIYGRMVSYHCSTIPEAQSRLSLECASSDFHTMYLVDDEGTVYTDRNLVYSKDQMDMLSEIAGESDKIARRYDYSTTTAEVQKEMLLYAIKISGYELEGKNIIAIVGLTNIRQIQDKMVIYSFTKDGVARGYSSVINPNGDYIVNIRRTASLNQQENMFEIMADGVRDEEWSDEVISQKMANKEKFYFDYTDKDGVSKMAYFLPIPNTMWYFVSMVERQVFTEQSRTFVFSSISMLVTAVGISGSLLLLMMWSRNKMIEANAESKARSEFLSNMSHEIRTPLNGIIGLLYLMRTNVKEEELPQLYDWIDKANSTANYLLSLVSDILDMSKLQAGKLDIINGPFMMDKVISAVESMQRGNIEGRGVTLTVDSQIDYPHLIGDETKLKQVLMNIVGNAAKFTPAGGVITITARQSLLVDGRVSSVISCADTGIGMSPEFLSTIWDTFSQEHNEKSDGTRGTGLGMAISKGFIDAMGGQLTVESQLNVGSTFTITLTLPQGEAPPPELSAPDELLPEMAQTSFRLLVAEDNQLNAEILYDILDAEGFEVVMAANGQIALEQFSQSEVNSFDAILMDMQMPVMDGCEATRAIRALDREDAATITIFACTANTFLEDKDRALASGMDDFLTKPIDVDALLLKLNEQKIRKIKEKKDER